MVAREMGEKMVLTLHPGIILKEIGGWASEPSMEDLQKFILKYPEEKNWHAQLHGRIATSLKKKGQWGKAIGIYQKIIDEYGELALPMFPGRILAKDQAQLGMADCYRQMGNHEKALAILDNLRNQATSRMIRRTAEKEYAELYNKVFNQNRQ
jgi:tetratricopeptide (TPR) repeat protein